MTEKALAAVEVPAWLERAGVTEPTATMPLLHERIDLTNPDEVARAWDELDGYIGSLVTFRKAMAHVMLAYMDSQARHTLAFKGVGKLRGDSSPTTSDYDVTVLTELLDCDPPLPEDRYNELVKAKVEYTVYKNVAKAVANSHPAWKEIIDRARVTKERARGISRAS